MPDSRFFQTSGAIALADLALAVEARLADPLAGSVMIEAITPLGRATPNSATFFSDKRYLPDLKTSQARACFVSETYADALPQGCAALIVSNPHAAFAVVAERFYTPRTHPVSEPPIHPDAVLEDGVVLSHGVVIGPGAKIGAGTAIGANTVIGPGVSIGRRCRIGANVVIGFALIGDRVQILAGAVIGEAGFGVTSGQTGAVDIPQLGRVILQDGVTVGANSCIDRGAWDDTVVGENTKLDNLVQIAHSVVIGRNCMLAAHTGISGSSKVGDGAVFGGRAGIADHIDIGAGARIAAAAGVMKDIPAGETWAGTPARPIRRFMRETAWLARNAYAKPGAGKAGD
jgi:UDP-3-O-[3-hydroxymyristoyl] glucosamine N-acyltransferase